MIKRKLIGAGAIENTWKWVDGRIDASCITDNRANLEILPQDGKGRVFVYWDVM